MLTQPTIKNVMSRVAINIIRSNLTASVSLLGTEVSVYNAIDTPSKLISEENKNFLYSDSYDLRELFIVTGFNFYTLGFNMTHLGYSEDGNETLLWEFDEFDRILPNAKVILNHLGSERIMVATRPKSFIDYNGMLGFRTWLLLPLSLDLTEVNDGEYFSDLIDKGNTEFDETYEEKNNKIFFPAIDKDNEMFGGS